MSWLKCMSSTLVGLPGHSWQWNLPCEAWLHLMKLHFYAGASDMAKSCRNEKFSWFYPLWSVYITSCGEQSEIPTPLHSDILRTKYEFKYLWSSHCVLLICVKGIWEVEHTLGETQTSSWEKIAIKNNNNNNNDNNWKQWCSSEEILS